MRVLVLGCSRIAQRRVIPALAGLANVELIDVATRRANAVPAGVISGQTFGDYGAALQKSSAELVYVSTVNADHFAWTQAALDSGRHVIVDKPSCLEYREAEQLCELAERRNLALAEATVYLSHPQFALLRAAFSDASPNYLVSVFVFPSLDPGDFRYRGASGGGAVYDLGPYAVSAGRFLFGSTPETVACQVTSHQADVDTAFSVLMTYPGGRSCVGTFAFGGAYTNRLVALSPSATVTLERAFTSVPAEGCRVRVQTEGRDETVVSDKGDAFSGFLGSVLQAIQAKEVRKFRQDLLHDAHAISQLRQAAGLIQ